MSGGESVLPDSEKVRIACDFLEHAPPGEFNEVFNSVRMLLNNDSLLKEECAPAITRYNTKQFVPVKLDGIEKQTLITPYNDLGNGRFFDDNSKKSFKYDHLRKEASDIQPHQGESGVLESWRTAIQKELDHYIDDHYPKSGVGCAFAKNGNVIICIESHLFQQKNFYNGRWRSEWTVPIGDNKSGNVEFTGKIKVQVHYYEDGNIQLFSDKEIHSKVHVTAEFDKTAKELIRIIGEEETSYQLAVQENYTNMSETTYKSLRRQLPIIRAKMDWHKVQSYRIGQEMKPQ